MERTLASQRPMHAMLLVVGMCRFKCCDICEVRNGLVGAKRHASSGLSYVDVEYFGLSWW